jgi:hypothetical protein
LRASKSGIDNHKYIKNMKRILAGIACLALSVGAFAQGTVIFSNTQSALGVPGGAPVFDVGGVVRLEGAAYLAQLFAGPNADSLQPWGASASPFRTGTGAGFWNPGADSTRIIGNVAPGATATIVVRAWEAAGGTSFDVAKAAGAKWGESAAFGVVTGGVGLPPSLPAPLVGLTSFSLVPEPSTYALLALGAAALFLRRRK